MFWLETLRESCFRVLNEFVGSTKLWFQTSSQLAANNTISTDTPTQIKRIDALHHSFSNNFTAMQSIVERALLELPHFDTLAQRASPSKTSKQLRNIPFAQLTNIFNSKSISTNEFKSEFIVVMVRQERKDYNNYLLFIYFSTYSIEMIIPMFFRVICLLLLNVLLACFQQSNSVKFLMRTKAILRCCRAFQGQSTNKWFSTVNKRIKVTNQ